MDAREFGLWAEFYRQEPFGGERGDLQAGIVAATVANYAGRMRSEQSSAAQPLDFMPLLKAQRQEPTPDEPDPVAYFQNLGKDA